ncbi:hypothetical protein G6F59_016133 [Rhizopus arrhizus]|nr:hypothetical protein G6F59_016133 [Rhizopus arrhizus]
MTKQIQDAYIVAATRTPVGKAPKGMFRNTRPDDMLAHVLRSVVAQAPGVDVNRIDDAIIGCAMPEAEQGMNVARIGVLLAGLPNTIAAQPVSRFCSSGLPAVAQAADAIRLGNADLMLADRDGTERVRQRPRRHRLRHGHHRRDGGRGREGLARRPGCARPRLAPEGHGRDPER